MQEAAPRGARRVEPSIHASDPRFTYTPAAGTNIHPHWPFGTLDPAVVEARRREARRSLIEGPEALM